MDEAPEFQDITGWINTDPLALDQLDDSIVLLHFWAYASEPCQRTLPRMEQLWNAYKDEGLVVIGVHTPAFDFERDEDNVRDAVNRLDIEYPVALDSKNTTWKLYGNRYWPRTTLIDKDGRIREEHIGEGRYARIEERIRRLIRWEDGDLDDPVFEREEEPPAENAQFVSPDIHAGERWGTELGNVDFHVCSPYARIAYQDEEPGQHELNQLYLNGEWIREKDHVVCTDAADAYVALRFSGQTGHAVMAAGDEQRVGIVLDGEPVPPEQRGETVEEDSQGTFVTVSEPGLYQLVDRESVDIGEVQLQPENEAFQLYSFTFR